MSLSQLNSAHDNIFKARSPSVVTSRGAEFLGRIIKVTEMPTGLELPGIT